MLESRQQLFGFFPHVQYLQNLKGSLWLQIEKKPNHIQADNRSAFPPGHCQLIEILLCREVEAISFLVLGSGPWEPVIRDKTKHWLMCDYSICEP